MSDYDRSIHTNPDASAWAKFFMETKAKNNWTIDQIDEELMLGWFSNAMMAMHDSRPATPPKSLVEEAHTASSHDCEALPKHTMCWEDASGMIRWKNETPTKTGEKA